MNPDEINYKVLVQCMTFNQSRYITDALNGFCMQKTDFPFVCVIMDDASTDGEQDVIKAYLTDHFYLTQDEMSYTEETDYASIIFARHKVNTNCYFKVFFLKENHYSNPDKYRGKKMEYIKDYRDRVPYEALCEGDDYWTDEQKLQKQTAFLDGQPDCTICFSKVQEVDINGNKIIGNTHPQSNQKINRIVCLSDYLKEEFYIHRWTFQTSSFCFRNKHFEELKMLISNEWKDFPMGDLPLILFLLTKGNGGYINESMSCYRIDSGGYTSNQNKDINLRIHRIQKLISALQAYDKYTCYKYHKYIGFHMLRLEYSIHQLSGGNDRLMFSRKYYRLLKEYPLKGKVAVFVSAFFPHLYKLMKSIL